MKIEEPKQNICPNWMIWNKGGSGEFCTCECRGILDTKDAEHVFTVEQIQSAFDNFGDKLKMDKSDIADAWNGFMIQLMGVYGVDVNYKNDGN